jgi:hypothetical protein
MIVVKQSHGQKYILSHFGCKPCEICCGGVLKRDAVASVASRLRKVALLHRGFTLW